MVGMFSKYWSNARSAHKCGTAAGCYDSYIEIKLSPMWLLLVNACNVYVFSNYLLPCVSVYRMYVSAYQITLTTLA